MGVMRRSRCTAGYLSAGGVLVLTSVTLIIAQPGRGSAFPKRLASTPLTAVGSIGKTKLCPVTPGLHISRKSNAVMNAIQNANQIKQPVFTQTQSAGARARMRTKAGLDDFMLIEDDFSREDPESKIVYGTIPQMWGDDDLRMDIEERMRIPVPPGLTGEDLKWMWVQCKIMTKPPKPSFNPNAKGWEYWRYERPKLYELYHFYQESYRTERINVLIEFCENPEDARLRYGNVADYTALMDNIQSIMDTPPVLSNKVRFSGFPAMLDEDTIRGTFIEFGEVVSLEITPPPPGEELKGIGGVVEFTDPEICKKAILQWNGVDMGMGTTLQLSFVEE